MRCVYVRLKWRSVAVAVIPLTVVREVEGLADWAVSSLLRSLRALSASLSLS
jgi:hypothetical protein